MSEKNKLQELFQKSGEPLPKYNTKRFGGEDHQPVWISSIIVQNREFTSNFHVKKIDAEQDVAKLALDYLQASEVSTVSTFTSSSMTFLDPLLVDELDRYDFIVFVDLENTPQVAKYQKNDSTIIIGVVGHCHPLAFQDMNNIKKCVIRSAVKDSADHALSFIAGIVSQYIKGQYVYVVSRDHYAEVTVNCLQSLGIHAQHLPQITQEELFSLK